MVGLLSATKEQTAEEGKGEESYYGAGDCCRKWGEQGCRDSKKGQKQDSCYGYCSYARAKSDPEILVQNCGDDQSIGKIPESEADSKPGKSAKLVAPHDGKERYERACDFSQQEESSASAGEDDKSHCPRYCAECHARRGKGYHRGDADKSGRIEQLQNQRGERNHDCAEGRHDRECDQNFMAQHQLAATQASGKSCGQAREVFEREGCEDDSDVAHRNSVAGLIEAHQLFPSPPVEPRHHDIADEPGDDAGNGQIESEAEHVAGHCPALAAGRDGKRRGGAPGSEVDDEGHAAVGQQHRHDCRKSPDPDHRDGCYEREQCGDGGCFCNRHQLAVPLENGRTCGDNGVASDGKTKNNEWKDVGGVAEGGETQKRRKEDCHDDAGKSKTVAVVADYGDNLALKRISGCRDVTDGCGAQAELRDGREEFDCSRIEADQSDSGGSDPEGYKFGADYGTEHCEQLDRAEYAHCRKNFSGQS